MLIESSPNSLDPRVGTDSQAERIDPLIFDSLVQRNEHFGLDPDLALRWETPNPLTYIFHLRTGVYFQNGRPLTSRDVKWTLDSVLHGTIVSVKAGAYKNISRVEAPDPATVVIHLSQPDPALLWDLCSAAIGIVPYGSGKDFWRHPIGTGPYRFVSQEIDKDVVIEASPNYWGPKPHIAHVRFAVVPDPTTRALELEKGSADVTINALSPDMVEALKRRPNLVVDDGPGSEVVYIVLNLRTPYLKDVRVRQAIANAINRPLIIYALLRDQAHVAESLLPEQDWAWTGDTEKYPYNPAAANALLDNAGYKRGADGIRFHINMKTSTDDTTRLLAAVLQEQLAKVGIALDLRSYEFATSHEAHLKWPRPDGLAATSSPTFFAMPIPPAVSLRTEATVASTPTLSSMRSSITPQERWISQSSVPTMFRFNRFSPVTCRQLISGTSTPSSSTRAGSRTCTPRLQETFNSCGALPLRLERRPFRSFERQHSLRNIPPGNNNRGPRRQMLRKRCSQGH
jgi:peptide/nickel transport system substrate-binding protein